MPDKNPLDYQSPKPSPADPMDTGVNNLWWVRLANRRKRGLMPSKLRLIYWVVMLTLIGLVLLYLRQHTTAQWDELMKPPKH